MEELNSCDIFVEMASKSTINSGINESTFDLSNLSSINLSSIDLADFDIGAALAIGLAQKVLKEAVVKVVKEVVQKEKFPQPSANLQRLAEPSMKSYINLYNDHRSVLKPDKLLRLEQKLSDMQKYSQIISDDLKVLIVDKIKGITASQASLLQIEIMQCLEKYIGANQDKPVPNFLETSYNFKCVKVVCADENSLNWLKQTVPPLTPWPGARLEVTLMSKYSVYSTVSRKRTAKTMPTEGVGLGRLKFAIPNSNVTKATTGQNAPAAVDTFTEIAKQIELRNAPIKVKDWKELHREDKGAYTIYFVSMDLDCIEELRKKGNRLFYKLGTIKVAPWNKNDELGYKKKRDTELVKAALAKTQQTAGKPKP